MKLQAVVFMQEKTEDVLGQQRSQCIYHYD